MEAGVYSVQDIGELNSMVANLAQQGFRIISVIDTQNGMYHVVAQKELPPLVTIATEPGWSVLP